MWNDGSESTPGELRKDNNMERNYLLASKQAKLEGGLHLKAGVQEENVPDRSLFNTMGDSGWARFH